jgi:GTPase SAR1 family protein
MKKNLKVTEIPVDPSAKHPKVPYDGILPQHEFTMGIIAPKGSGKTTLLLRLLEFYKDYFHTILVFSPTVHADEKWDYIMKKPLLSENIKLIKFLAKKKKPLNEIVGEPSTVVEKQKEKFEPKLTKENLLDTYDEEILGKILDEQMNQIQALKKLGADKYYANRMLLIFDDLVGSNLFDLSPKNPFTGFNTRHRHYSASVIMIAQTYKAVPSIIRKNYSCLIIFEIANNKELDVIYEENECGLKKDKWEEIYKFCVEDNPYDFMFLDITKKDRNSRVMKNFDQIVYFCDT